jgi:hypothetical protein
VRHVACIRGMGNVHKSLFSKPEGNRPRGRLGSDGKMKGREWGVDLDPQAWDNVQ